MYTSLAILVAPKISSLLKAVFKPRRYAKPLPVFSRIHSYQRAALENLQIVLAAAGSGLEHIVKANIYMLNMEKEFQLMNEVYATVKGHSILNYLWC